VHDKGEICVMNPKGLREKEKGDKDKKLILQKKT
jgi:hypothetical protein